MSNYMHETKIKHLEMIQAIINRMNANSFLIKGWVITIVTAVLALLASTHNKAFMALTALPILIFWILDSMYLQAERKFITLYQLTVPADTAITPFDLNIKKSKVTGLKRNTYLRCLFSRTMTGFYLSLLVLAGAAMFFIREEKEKKEPLQVQLTSRDTVTLQHLPFAAPAGTDSSTQQVK